VAGGKASQGRLSEDGADMLDSYLHCGTVFGPRQERDKISLVTMAALCFFIIAQ